MEHHRSSAKWYCRKYKLFPGEKTLRKDASGKILNECVWEDPKIKTGDNYNIVTTAGRMLSDYTLLALSGSGHPLWMAMGSGTTSPSVTQDRLVYELIGDVTRPAVTLSNGSPLDATAVSATPYSDTNYTPSYEYYAQFTVLGEMNGATSANVGAPIQEVGLVTNRNCPGTPTGISGVLWNRYLFAEATTLDSETIFQAVVVYHS
jgi:hypothetical protein